ncbi:DUF664 domain-containing protein [Solwaraspora sp. WMMD406]|uniref:mycothiol transferase n=1 Tax=Solwaraspora sp. WMMD406 TaxID=3016095 RepID=UPI002415A70C|nr:DUF664 domain-containing protein [Solwaraspora sp. WMMD406]MDG4767179.1 DUF664 domain-containing protein [Solwaraspora sp. WMMD406]
MQQLGRVRSNGSCRGDAYRVSQFGHPHAGAFPAAPRGDERATLSGFLHWHRRTLELKCHGLEPEQLARRLVLPSTMSLLGLVRHMADVDRHWFRRVMAGEDAAGTYRRGGRAVGRGLLAGEPSWSAGPRVTGPAARLW